MQRTLRILVVEDDELTRRAVGRALAMGEKYAEVTEAGDGVNALELMSGGSFDCVLLDHFLPGMEGLEILRQAKSRGIRTPIILLTARGDEQLAVEVMKAGAADYLSKSRMSPELLAQAVRNAIRVRRAEDQATEAQSRLRENEERLTRVLETTVDGIVILDAEGRRQYINPAAEKILGLEPGGESRLALEDPASPIWSALRSGRSVQGQEMLVPREEGKWAILSVNASPLRDGATVSGVVATIRDVTSERHAAESLKRERDFSSAVVDTSGSLIVVLDGSGRIVRFNNACQRVTGYSFEEVEGRVCWDLLLAAEERQDVRGVFDKLVAGDHLSHYENHWVSRSGRKRLISWSNTVISQNGQVQYIVATGIDVTEERMASEALRRSRQDYASLVHSLQGVVWEADPGTLQFTFVSRQAEALLGFPMEQWLGMPDFWEKHVHPGDLEAARGFRLEEVRAGRDHTLEYRMIAADGRAVWVRDLTSVVKGEHGERKLRGILLDVTDRKRAEAFREGQNRVLKMLATGSKLGEILAALARSVEEQVPDAQCAVLLNRGGRLFFEAAPGFPREYLADYAEGVAIGENCGSCGTAAFTKRVTVCRDITMDPAWGAHRKLALRHGFRAAWSFPIVGPETDVMGTVAVYYRHPRWPEDFELRTVEVAAGLAEIAIERTRGEGALHQTNQRLSALVEASPLAIIASDRDYRVNLWNPAAERLFGFTADEAIGQFPPQVPPDKVAEATASMERTMAGQPQSGLEVRRVRKDGKMLDLVLSSAALRDPDGNVSGVMALFLDMTERNRLKEQLLQAQKMEAVGRLAGGIAHDFNNLLAVISGYTESLARRVRQGDPMQEHLSEIQRQADRGGALTRQLLGFSRRQGVRVQHLNLNEIVGNLHGMLRRLISDKIAVQFKPAKDLRLVEADVGQMEQVVMNLALNARDAMPEGGQLMIRTSNVELKPTTAQMAGLPPGPYVRLSVSDTGTGIDPETRQHIFEPFFTTKDNKGTGLGLTIVYGIAQQCGGTVTVQSDPGKGARFDVYLPAVPQGASVTASSHSS